MAQPQPYWNPDDPSCVLFKTDVNDAIDALLLNTSLQAATTVAFNFNASIAPAAAADGSAAPAQPQNPPKMPDPSAISASETQGYLTSSRGRFRTSRLQLGYDPSAFISAEATPIQSKAKVPFFAVSRLLDGKTHVVSFDFGEKSEENFMLTSELVNLPSAKEAHSDLSNDAFLKSSAAGSTSPLWKVHKGVLERAMMFPRRWIREQLKAKKHVILTGFGCGGSVASCVALLLMLVDHLPLKAIDYLRVYTYGSPPFVSKELADFLDYEHPSIDIFRSILSSEEHEPSSRDPVTRILTACANRIAAGKSFIFARVAADALHKLSGSNSSNVMTSVGFNMSASEMEQLHGLVNRVRTNLLEFSSDSVTVFFPFGHYYSLDASARCIASETITNERLRKIPSEMRLSAVSHVPDEAMHLYLFKLHNVHTYAASLFPIADILHSRFSANKDRLIILSKEPIFYPSLESLTIGTVQSAASLHSHSVPAKDPLASLSSLFGKSQSSPALLTKNPLVPSLPTSSLASAASSSSLGKLTLTARGSDLRWVEWLSIEGFPMLEKLLPMSTEPHASSAQETVCFDLSSLPSTSYLLKKKVTMGTPFAESPILEWTIESDHLEDFVHQAASARPMSARYRVSAR